MIRPAVNSRQWRCRFVGTISRFIKPKGSRITRCKHLSETPAFGFFRGWHQPKIMGGFRDEIAGLSQLYLRSRLPRATASLKSQGHKMSDEELIKLSLSAAPEAIAKDATVVAMDHDGKMRTLRKGTGQWTCMPGHADPANPDPMCGDQNAMEWATAWMNHKEPPANKVGFMYMLRGDGGASNTDPYATKEEPGNNWVKTGAHVMIVGSGAKMLDGYPRDAKADPTRPYVMWPGTQYEHLMLPVR